LVFFECVHSFTAQYGLIASLFLGGLVGSLTHCAMMCSPFVLAQSEAGPVLERPARSLLLPYHLGRMTTYIGLGVLFHSVVNLAYLFSGARVLISAPLLMLAGVLFLISVFPSLSSLFPWAKPLSLPSGFLAIGGRTSALMRSTSPLPRYGLGILLGFMPCGLVVAALMAAATAPSAAQAALAMAAFSIGTMPALMAIGVCGKSLKQRFPKQFRQLSQTAMVVSSLWLFALAGSLIF
jgi:hypothetical protein